MHYRRSYITSRGYALLGLRLVALYLFFGMLSSIGYLLYNLAKGAPWQESIVGYQLAVLVVYCLVLLVLLQFPDPIAGIIAKGLPKFTVQSRWSRVELVAVVLAGVAALEILSEVPALFNRLHAILSDYQDMMRYGGTERGRFNLLFVGLLATFVKIIVAAFVFARSGRIAVAWDNWQTQGGLSGMVRRRKFRLGR